jgi:hypothetical protein
MPGLSPVWVCSPNRLHCAREHVRRSFKEGGSYDQRRIDGHVFAKCDECGECYVAVFHSRPDPIAYCYAISDAQWRWWNSAEGVDYELDERQPTQHLLHLLGFNRYYRPTNPATLRPTPR